MAATGQIFMTVDTQLPDDAAALVRAINLLVQRGSSRVTATLPGKPGPFTPTGGSALLDYPTTSPAPPSASDRDTWNPNGADQSLTPDSLFEKLRRTTMGTGVNDPILAGT
jgi:hypothetical protein